MTFFERIGRAAFLATVCATVASVASAGDSEKKPAGSGPNPYTDCGIGAALFPNTHWAAVTSNVIWDAGTTALTSATASPETCNGKNVKAAMFIGTSYDELIEETAAGQGRHLTAVLNLFGCSSERHGDVISRVRASMGRSVAAPGYSSQSRIEKANVYYTAAEQAVAGRCSA